MRIEPVADDAPVINMILAATEKVAEALNLLEAAMQAAKAKSPNGEATIAGDFAFLDCRLEDVDWGFDYQKRFVKAFEDWNRYEMQNGNIDRRRLLITVRDLLKVSEDELRAQPNVGRSAIARIQAVLAKHGLRLNL
jgi:DNA-directed RNA polymerase alpha subunit